MSTLRPSAGRTSHLRRAFTLLEVIIAATILAVIMGMVLQALLATSAHEASASAQDELAADAEKIRTAITADLSLSGWHIPDGSTSVTIDPSTGNVTPGESALDTVGIDAGRLSRDQATDRTLRYYPYVVAAGTGQNLSNAPVARRGVRFKHATTPALFDIDIARLTKAISSTAAVAFDVQGAPNGPGPNHPSMLWYATFDKPSQSLIFLRMLTPDGMRGLYADPQNRTPAEQLAYGKRRASLPVERMGATDDSDLALWQSSGNHDNLKILPASPLEEDRTTGAWIPRPNIFDEYGNPIFVSGTQLRAYGRPLETGYAVPQSDGSLRIQPQWETITAPTRERPASEDVWREYMYTVIRQPGSALHGRLVRAHKAARGAVLGAEIGNTITDPSVSGPYEFVIDQVLSDNVVRITFDTWRTDRYTLNDPGRLDINQIRVRVFLARPDFVAKTSLTRVLTFNVTMRAKNTEGQRAEDAILIGLERPGFPR